MQSVIYHLRSLSSVICHLSSTYVICATTASYHQTSLMIKYLLAGWICLCTVETYSQKENKNISSKIDKVTVFLQGAQVERSAKQALPAGKYNIVFSDISPRIDKQSIQLKAEG